jgi:5-methylcytosine-specific restriction endonuclease McrA
MPRRCFREPIAEIFEAAELLEAAANAHLVADTDRASNLIAMADKSSIAAWTESIWGKRSLEIHRFVEQVRPAPHLSSTGRPSPRMPDTATRSAIIERDGYHCRFCGIPVIPAEVRQLLNRTYPDVARWGPRNVDQHAALQCMWLQFDHLIPNERGGASDFNNVMVTCAPCNFGRMQLTIEEADLDNPFARVISPTWAGFSDWDGLIKLLS